MFDTGFMRLDRDSEVLFQEHDELESRDRIENPAGDERCAPVNSSGSSPGRNSFKM